MSVQILINDLPQNTPIESTSLNATVERVGSLFFLDGVQTELTNDEINDLHSDYMLNDMQSLNEFTQGCYYEL